MLQTRACAEALAQSGVKLAPLVGEWDHSVRPDWAHGAADLVDVPAKVQVHVAVVVPLSDELQFTHEQLRRELERSLASVLLWRLALERVGTEHVADFVLGLNPGLSATTCLALGHGGLDFRLDVLGLTVLIQDVEAERLRIDAESQTTVAFKAIASNGLLTQLEGASGQSDEVFLDVSVIAEDFQLIDADEHSEVIAFSRAEWLNQKLFTSHRGQLVKAAEVHLRVWQLGVERRVDLLHVAGDERVKALALLRDELDAGATIQNSANIRVDDLKDALFQRLLRVEVGILERGAGGLDADLWPTTALGLERILVFRGARFILIGASAAEFHVVCELRLSERGGHGGWLLDYGANHIRDIGDGATLEGVDEWRFASEHLGDAALNAVDVTAGEIIDRCDVDTIVWHGILR